MSPPLLLLLDVFALRKVVFFSLVLQHLHYCFPRLLMPSSEILTDRTLIDPVRGHAPVPQMECFMNWHVLPTSSDDPVTVLSPFYLREPMWFHSHIWEFECICSLGLRHPGGKPFSSAFLSVLSKQTSIWVTKQSLSPAQWMRNRNQIVESLQNSSVCNRMAVCWLLKESLLMAFEMDSAR